MEHLLVQHVYYVRRKIQFEAYLATSSAEQRDEPAIDLCCKTRQDTRKPGRNDTYVGGRRPMWPRTSGHVDDSLKIYLIQSGNIADAASFATEPALYFTSAASPPRSETA